MHSNAKAVVLLPVVVLWSERRWATLAWAAGFFVLGLAALALAGALPGYWQQVWEFGRLYSRNTFVGNPWREGPLRSANWLGFHAALAIPAVVAWWKLTNRDRLRFGIWLAAGAVSVLAGLRFFPRYYLMLLGPLVLLAARGLVLARKSDQWCMRLAWVLAALLLIVPLIRFGPRYVILAGDLLTGRPHHWADVALNEDSQAAAAIVKAANGGRAGATLLVWGYRPDVFAYTRMSAATKFLDSQMLTGVLADRHLLSNEASVPEAGANRQALVKTAPDFVVDGLGPLNPSLGIEKYPELWEWLSRNYKPVGKTRYSLVYRRKPALP